MDYTDCCRTCLTKSTKMTKLSAFVTITNSVVRLSDILATHYDYKIDNETETYPSSLCSRCVDQLSATHTFKSVFDSSTTTLENCNHVEIKNEIEFEDTNYDNDLEIDTELDLKPDVRQTSPSPPPAKKVIDDTRKVKRYKTRRLMRRKPNTQVNLPEIPMSALVLNDYFCVECKKQFSSKDSLREHCAEHPVKGTVGKDCELCDEKFASFKSLVIHKKLHAKPFLCLACWLGFYTESEMQTHNCSLIKKVPLSNEICQCDQCGKSYRRGYIKVHLKTHEEESKYSCKYCPKKFKIPSTLSSHVLYNHTRTKNFHCHICNATFMSASKRSTHIRKHHLHEKKYVCELCAKRFFSKSEVDRHRLTHTGVKNFHCHLCEKSYQTKYGLTVHLKSHGPMLNPVLNM